MKIRRELNRQLYQQKIYGFERHPYYLEDAVFEAVTNGDTEKLMLQQEVSFCHCCTPSCRGMYG